MIDVHPNLSLQLTRTISVDGGGDVFRRYSRNDAVYAVPGFVAIPGNDKASMHFPAPYPSAILPTLIQFICSIFIVVEKMGVVISTTI